MTVGCGTEGGRVVGLGPFSFSRRVLRDSLTGFPPYPDRTRAAAPVESLSTRFPDNVFLYS
jgi:hypothetical protein